MSRKGGWYDEADDYYDEYEEEEDEEEDWDDGFGAYDTGSLAKPKKGSSAAAKPPAGSGAKKPPGPARSGAKPASAMAAKMSADPSEKGVRRPALPGSASRAPGAPPGFPAAPSAGRAAGAFAFDTPSPDDVVLAKRRNDRAGGSDRAAPSDSDVASGAALATLAVSDGRRRRRIVVPRSRRHQGGQSPHPSDVAAFAAAPRRLHLVVLGHVDAGKSTLMGRLMHASGAVSEKERRANQKDADAAGKASFSWAFALDSRPEERERGVTVDVAQASIETRKDVRHAPGRPGARGLRPERHLGDGARGRGGFGRRRRPRDGETVPPREGGIAARSDRRTPPPIARHRRRRRADARARRARAIPRRQAPHRRGEQDGPVRVRRDAVRRDSIRPRAVPPRGGPHGP